MLDQPNALNRWLAVDLVSSFKFMSSLANHTYTYSSFGPCFKEYVNKCHDCI